MLEGEARLLIQQQMRVLAARAEVVLLTVAMGVVPLDRELSDRLGRVMTVHLLCLREAEVVVVQEPQGLVQTVVLEFNLQ